MKPIQSVAIVGLLATLCYGAASAQTVLRVTGSTAFRNATVSGIADYLATTNGGGTPTAVYVPPSSGTASLAGSGQSVIYGPTTNGAATQVIVECAWNGSVGGINTVANAIPLSDPTNPSYYVQFLNQATYASSAQPVTLQTAGSGNAVTALTSAQVSATSLDATQLPDVTLSDVYQKSTPFTTPNLTDTQVGIVPFRWVASSGSSLTAMTPQLAQALYKSLGRLPLASFTGLNGDESKLVYGLGRDADSGTRLTAFAETGVGVSSAVQQYYPYDSNGNIIGTTGAGTTIASFALVPDSTINGKDYPLGNSGYGSGGNLATALKNTITNGVANTSMVTYLGLSDSNSALGAGAVELSYNGFKYSPVAVYEGNYTFWGYEHMLYKAGTGLATAKKNVAIGIAAKITGGDDLVSGLSVGSMRCARTGLDGTQVLPNYSY